MNRHPPHPLTPEERALAERLARLGPHGEPSPALDAKILAAAHAAAAGRPVRARRRWFAWSGVPASLITGTGLAASLALTVGLVWQLRPLPTLLPPARESAEEVFVVTQPLPSSEPALRAPAPPPALLDETAPARPAAASARAAAEDARSMPPAAATELTRKTTPNAAPPVPSRDAGAASDAAFPLAPQPAEPTAAPAAAPVLAPPPPPPAPSVESPRRRASYTSAARATATAHEQRNAARAAAARQAAQRDADASQTRAAARTLTAGPQGDRATRDRIEVTGSRLQAGALSVQDETKLEPDDWLQHVRALRDAGDLDEARASLQRWRAAHPQHELPDDLRVLLPPPDPR